MNHFIHSKGRTAILTALVFSLSGLLVLPAGAEDLSYVADSGKDGVNVVTRSRAEITRRERSTPRLWWKYGKNTAISSDADIGRVQTVKSKPVEVRRDLSQSNHGSGRVVTAYPTGSQSSSMVLLEKIAPKQVALNEPYDYVMKVTNLTNNHLTDVAVKDQFPSSFTAQSIEPEANETRNGLHTWFLGNLGPKEERLIKIRGVAESAGKHTHCATVTYVCPNCIDVEVVEPKLRLAQSAPSDVLLCDIIPIKYTVTNPGTGATRNATVTASLPTGLKTKDGKTSVTLNAGPLAPGQSRDFTVNAVASRTGTFVASSKASAGILSATSNRTTTKVYQPVLSIEKSCPSKVYLGRNVNSVITVRNTGDAMSRNTIVEATLPAGSTFVSASNSGQLAGNKVVWNLGTLAIKRSQSVNMTVKPDGIGTLLSGASVKGVCADTARDTCRTKVIGIPAILLEVVDIADPVQVGDNETYIITATNQGTSTATNVSITVNLEENEQYVSSHGATIGSANGRTITFRPLAQLAAKAKASWKVIVKAVKDGDVRLKVSMNSDQLTRPVEETEATYLYK